MHGAKDAFTIEYVTGVLRQVKCPKNNEARRRRVQQQQDQWILDKQQQIPQNKLHPHPPPKRRTSITQNIRTTNQQHAQLSKTQQEDQLRAATKQGPI
ncbi:hypothetical protein ACJMK2_004013 [Sinanodonta woodiana]|uniref:Uncharacterized protein n=1 Tax=Sinanodonta woodiana TaxID=1069815 RepID=A0ABD3XZW7_SINWO